MSYIIWIVAAVLIFVLVLLGFITIMSRADDSKSWDHQEDSDKKI